MTSAIQFHAQDAGTKAPIGNARVTGTMTRHAFAQGDSVLLVSEYTNPDGGVQVMVDDFVGYDVSVTFEANGYLAQNQNAHAPSMNGPFGVWANMNRLSIDKTPPPGQGIEAIVAGKTGAVGTTVGTGLAGLGTQAAIVLVVVAVVVLIGLVLLAYLLGPGTLSGAVKK
jgi:hypothetical protein